MTAGPHAMADRLVAILERERRASDRNLREVHALSLEERVASGDAVRGLTLARPTEPDERIVRLECRENLSRFRDGDTLWLGDGNRIRGGIPVVLRDHDPVARSLRVELDGSGAGGPLGTVVARKGHAELVLDRRDLDLTDRIIGAVRALFARRDLEAIRGLLLGQPVSDPVATVGDLAEAADLGLDSAQAAAFVAACTAPYAVIQGPPGAGKTRLAAAIAAAFARRGQSILVTAFTHRAVNNLLLAIARLGIDLPILKIGGSHQAEGLADAGIGGLGSARRLPRQLDPTVVGITTHGAIGLHGRAPFDLLLVDEAGQVSLAHACGVLPLARRHVVIGDHQQLPPLIVAEHRDPLASRSLFEHLHDAYGSHLLTRTYRMNAELCRFPSAAFYGGRLQPAGPNQDRRLRLAGDPGPVLAAEPPAVIVPMAHRGARILAPQEAEVAAALVARAIACGLAPEEVAVIAPHRAQGARIRTLLRERLALEPGRLPLVDTVERLQGGERDLIVLSLTASDPEEVCAEASFFFSPNRLNVSLTRARKKLVVLMSDALLDAFPDDPRALLGADLLRQLWRTTPHVAWHEPAGRGDASA